MATNKEAPAVAVPKPPELKKWLMRTVLAVALALTVSGLVSLVRTHQKAEEEAKTVAATATHCSDVSALETRRCFVVGKSNRWKNASDGPLPGDQMKVCYQGAELKNVVEAGTAQFWFEVESKKGTEAAYRLFPVTEKCPLTL